MTRWTRFHRWSAEAATRARALLVMVTLVTVGGVTNRYVPRLPAAQTLLPTGPVPFRPPHNDSVFTIARPTTLRAPGKASLKRYRRSAQVDAAVAELRSRALLLPLPDLAVADLHDSFEQVRAGGTRRHHAIDIPAPRGTPILAVEDGIVLEMKTGGDGGVTLFAADARGQFIYYYAHLLKYHPRIEQGLVLVRGDTIGYVGTTGNAPENTPHLHFAILLSSNLARWSKGTPVNPAEVWRN